MIESRITWADFEAALSEATGDAWHVTPWEIKREESVERYVTLIDPCLRDILRIAHHGPRETFLHITRYRPNESRGLTRYGSLRTIAGYLMDELTNVSRPHALGDLTRLSTIARRKA